MKSSEAKMRILVISQYFYPEEFRINDLCSAWVSKGYDVTVITGIPNYPKGKFFQGYGLFKRRKDEYQGVSIVRLPILSRGKGFVRLSLNYLSFVVSGFFFATFTRLNAEVVFINEVSPMTQALPGIWFGKRKGIPVYLYVQDLWPENIEATIGSSRRGLLRRIDTLVRKIYRDVDKIFTSSNAYISNIASKGIDPKKMYYWPQYAEHFYQPLPRINDWIIPDTPSKKIIFTGNMGLAQGLDTILDVAKATMHLDIEYYLIGDGSEKAKLMGRAKTNQLTNVHFLESVKATEIPQYIAQCDLAYLSLIDEPIYELTVPAKLQSYFACGIPVLASAKGEVARIIQESHSGFVCTPGDKDSLIGSITEFTKLNVDGIDQLKRNARSAYETMFDKDMLLNQMDTHLLGEANEN
jgi:glycosyltransferase involved in cell wall biosynthesis